MKSEKEVKIDDIFQSILGDYEGAVIDSVAFVEYMFVVCLHIFWKEKYNRVILGSLYPYYRGNAGRLH